MGQETGADAKFQQAQKLLEDKRLPHIQEDGAQQVVVNRDMVADLRVFEVLGEALDLMGQAIDLWSRPAMSKWSEALVECVGRIEKHLITVEGCFALDMEVLLASRGVADLIFDGPSTIVDCDAEQVAVNYAAHRH